MEEGKELDALDEIQEDVTYVFGFVEGERPQPRAHAYLSERGAYRTATDTAMEAACRDLVSRAYACGHRDGMRACGNGEALAAKLTTLSGELLETALVLRGQR